MSHLFVRGLMTSSRVANASVTSEITTLTNLRVGWLGKFPSSIRTKMTTHNLHAMEPVLVTGYGLDSRTIHVPTVAREKSEISDDLPIGRKR